MCRGCHDVQASKIAATDFKYGCTDMWPDGQMGR